VQQGKVRNIGCSNWQAWKTAKGLGVSEFTNLARFDTLQAYYSIAGRDLERGNRSHAGIRKGRPARVESACRRLAFRQVQPAAPEARGFAPHFGSVAFMVSEIGSVQR